MQMSASPLAFLAPAAPSGKTTTSSSGSLVQKSGRAGAETGLNSEQADGTDMPEETSSFSRILRDQTASASTDEARTGFKPQDKPENTSQSHPANKSESASDTKSKPAGDTDDQPPGPTSEEEASASAGFSELNTLLASLMQGQGPARTAGGVDSPRAQAGASAMGKEDAIRPDGASQGKGRAQRSASISLDKAAAGDGQATKPGPGSASREIVSAGTAGTRSALGVGGTGPAASPTASDASQQLRAAVQRTPSSDVASATTSSSSSTPAANAPLNMPINNLSAGASSSSAASSAAATVDTSVAQDIRRPEFVPAFSARIATLVQEGVEHARVHLNPVDMGPVSLQLALDGQQVRVDMTAELAATRQVLEQALPTLAGALREAGFTLSGGGVAPPAEAANTGGQDARGSQGSQGEPQPQSSGNPTGLSGQASDGRRQAQGEPGQAALGTALGIAEGLTTEIHLDAAGTPRLAHRRGLVDTFA